jgi:hypothetical protein
MQTDTADSTKHYTPRETNKRTALLRGAVLQLPKALSRTHLQATLHIIARKEVKPTSDELCKMMKVKIVWQGSKCDKLHEIIWKIELFIVYAREN